MSAPWALYDSVRVRSGAARGLASTGLVLVIVVLSASTRPLTTAALGCLIAVLVGVRPDWVRLPGSRRATATPAGGRRDQVPVSFTRISAEAPRPLDRGTATAVPSGLQVRWWRRDGHDRLYVTDPAGTSLGWLDRATGTLHVVDEHHRDSVEDVLRAASCLDGRRSA